ncbi:MAG TPA: type VI secretion system tip protein VgrG [Polyangiaceae bacterium]|nr:type VI secretion system tip protein VgrG [Polyangiaceae bacterium]
MNERGVLLASPAFDGASVEVVALTGTEALNELYELKVDVLVDPTHDHRERAERLLDSPATLTFLDDGSVVRQVHGMVCDLAYVHEVENTRSRLSLSIVPRMWALTQQFGAELFLDVTVPDVLQRKLESVGLRSGEDFVFSLSSSYPRRELIVQYEETDHAFFSRLCEHEGIVTFFKQVDGRDVVVLTDDGASFEPIPHAEPIPVRARRDHPAAYDVETTFRRRPETSLVHDYNYRAPRLPLIADAKVARPAVTRTWVEYGAHTKSPDETQRIAEVRSQELAAAHEVVRGGCSELTMFAGGVLTLEHPLHGTQRLLITRLEHSAAPGDESETDWDNRFEAIPAEVPFRPSRTTPRPRISGLINARVDGEVKGHYAEIDGMGRYHVQMGFDRSGRTDLKASHPVRMMQPHAGAHYGMHFPLRPGAEVLVGFVDGNPDRPVIVGSAPNPETASPVNADNFTQNVLRTKSNNELVIEDELTNERIRLHTPREATTLQLGSEEEPEIGALLATEGHISHASRGSHNVAAARSTVLTAQASTLVGGTTVLLSGLADLEAAAERGLRQPGAIFGAELTKQLTELALPPDELADRRAEGAGDSDSAEETTGAPMHGLWSAIGHSLTESAEATAFEAVGALAFSSDTTLDDSIGRRQGERIGSPLGPASLIGAANTASLFSRDTTLLFADRIATLSSHDTAAVVGGQVAELKSPGTTEVAGRSEVAITSEGELSQEAHTVRVVGGYYPEAIAPPLDDGTSVGIMSRHDFRLTSVEDCILVCANKNLIGSAHTGDIRLTAKDATTITAAGIHLSATTVTIGSENTTIKASDTVEIEAQTVIVKAPSILLDGSVTITGDLTVCGKLDAKDDSKLASG